MEKLRVIKKCIEFIFWLYSFVVVKKKNSKFRVCLDFSNFNCVVMCEYFFMQIVEDVISRMFNVKVFSVFDVNYVFWQVKLVKDSSKLVIFNILFGWYSYKCLLFRIVLILEVFQNVMFYLFWGIEGFEVIVDDFVVWGKDVEQYDVRFRKMLDCYCGYNFKFNREKCYF